MHKKCIAFRDTEIKKRKFHHHKKTISTDEVCIAIKLWCLARFLLVMGLCF